MKSYDELKVELEKIQQQMVLAKKNERANTLKEVKHLSKIIITFKECWKGKTLMRTLHNLYLRSVRPFHGNGIDFGAKNATSSYYKFIDVTNAEMTYTDLYSNNTETVKSVDFEKDFDLSGLKYDFALCMNTLEHVYNHQSFLNNISKCLNDGGRIEGVVPFLHYYHPDPDDYFRYTHSALKRILANAGFDDIHITKLGKGGFTVFTSMFSRVLKFKPLIWICWMNAISLDFVLSKIWKTNRNIYLALAFSAKKVATNKL